MTARPCAHLQGQQRRWIEPSHEFRVPDSIWAMAKRCSLAAGIALATSVFGLDVPVGETWVVDVGFERE